MFPFGLTEPVILVLGAIAARSVFSKEPFEPLDPFSLMKKKEKLTLAVDIFFPIVIQNIKSLV